MEISSNNKPFQFKNHPNRIFSDQGRKFALRQTLQRKKDKQRLRRIVKLRRIHLQRYISVKYNGTRWWNRTLNPYYEPLTEEEILACRQNTTSDIMLQFEEILGPSKSYIDIFIFNNHPQFTHKDSVRILYRGKINKSKQQIFQLITYKIRRTENNEDDCLIVERNTYKRVTRFYVEYHRFRCNFQLPHVP